MYSPDGKTIASGSIDGTVRRYPARFEDVLALARQYAPRELTVEERGSLLGEEQ
jgi:WD40 repeat protein